MKTLLLAILLFFSTIASAATFKFINNRDTNIIINIYREISDEWKIMHVKIIEPGESMVFVLHG